MYREWKKIEFPKRVLYMNLGTRRLRGRPRNRWQDEAREDGRIVGGEGWQEKYIRDRNGRSSWEWQGIVEFCMCRRNEYWQIWIGIINMPSTVKFQLSQLHSTEGCMDKWKYQIIWKANENLTLNINSMCNLVCYYITGVLISPYPDLLPDVFSLMVRIFRFMLVLFYVYIYIYIYTHTHTHTHT